MVGLVYLIRFDGAMFCGAAIGGFDQGHGFEVVAALLQFRVTAAPLGIIVPSFQKYIKSVDIIVLFDGVTRGLRMIVGLV